MNKDEILEKSRNENKNQDIYEKDVLIKAGNIGGISGAVIGVIMYCVQIFLGGGPNYALGAMIFGTYAAVFMVKAVKLKRKREIVVAVMYSLATLMLAAAHIYNVVTASAII